MLTAVQINMENARAGGYRINENTWKGGAHGRTRNREDRNGKMGDTAKGYFRVS